MQGIIVIDVGTTSMRGILYDGEGRIKGREQRQNPPVYEPDGRVEQAPITWIEGLFAIAGRCVERAREASLPLAAVALTAQRSSVIPVDSTGAPLRPAIMWQDRRTEELCAGMRGQLAEVYGRSGARTSPVFSAVKMRWIRENEPDVYGRTHKLVGIQDLLIHMLTGKYVTDHTFAGRTNLMNVCSLTWDEELLSLFGVERRLLCDLITPGSVAGTVTARASQATGLPEGLPVVSAGGDQNCAALGFGVCKPGILAANTGTGSFLIAHADKPVLDPKMGLVCNAAAIPGAYIIEASILASGAIYRWMSDLFHGSSPDGDFLWINAEAGTAPVGAHGVILLPYLKGAGSPRWNPAATGTFLNITLGTTRADMARAVLEGIAAELAENVALMEELVGPLPLVNASGGLTRLPLFNQIQSDVMNRTVRLQESEEATSNGAWINAAVTIGLFPSHAAALAAITEGKPSTVYAPNPAAVSLYEGLFHRRSRAAELLESGGYYEMQG